MKILKLENRSEDYISHIIKHLLIEEKHISRAENILRKSKNIAVIYEGQQMIGLINFKFALEKGGVYCPVYLLETYAIKDIALVLNYIKSEFPDIQITFCKIISMFYNKADHLIEDKTLLCDRDLTMKLSHPLHKKFETEDYMSAFEELEYSELLNIHLDAYRDEVPYAGEEWSPLLEYYLNKQNHKTIVCRHHGEIAGLCLTIEDDNAIGLYSVCVPHHYRNKKIGSLMLSYLFQETNKNEYRLNVIETNISAFSLYKSFGFTVSEISALVFNNSPEFKDV